MNDGTNGIGIEHIIGDDMTTDIAHETEASGGLGLAGFLDTYRDSIVEQITQGYAPAYWPSKDRRPLPPMLRQPMGAQNICLRAAATSMQTHRGTQIIGEMGTGKTFMAIAAAQMAGFRRVLVVCPTHLLNKWRREILRTLPDVHAVIVKTVSDLESVRSVSTERAPLYVVMSKETMKNGYSRRPAFVERYTYRRSDSEMPDDPEVEVGRLAAFRDPYSDAPAKGVCCPRCFAPVKVRRNGELAPLPAAPELRRKEVDDLAAKKRRCHECDEPLWQADRGRFRRPRFPLAEYVKLRMDRFFDLLIADEAHKFKAADSAQGIAARTLAEACRRTLSLTGTYMGGYSSTMFFMLWGLSMQIRDSFGYNDMSRFRRLYGFSEWEVETSRNDDVTYGRHSRRRLGGRRLRVKELPGVSPAVMFEVLPNTVFAKVEDVAADMAPYHEEVRGYALSDEEDEATGLSQRSAYRFLASELLDALKEALSEGDHSLLGAYIRSLLAYPDGCVFGETVRHPRSGEVIVDVPPLPDDRLYPKERALLELIEGEAQAGRRVLLYVQHTATRDVTERLSRVISERGFRVSVMKSDRVSAVRRERWIADRVNDGLDVLVCHPGMVETGFDLLDFPTICWYEVEYSVYTMRQASRRSWRIGQTRPVRVVYMAYRGTAQDRAVRLNAEKMRASLAVEGDLPEGGLAAFGDSESGESLVKLLARSIVSGDVIEGSLEDVFARSQDYASRAQNLMVASDWAELPDAATAPIASNGHSNGSFSANGHDDLPRVNGVNGRSNGHQPGFRMDDAAVTGVNGSLGDDRAVVVVNGRGDQSIEIVPSGAVESDAATVRLARPPSVERLESSRSGLLAVCPHCDGHFFPFGVSQTPFPPLPAQTSVVTCNGCDRPVAVIGTEGDPAPTVEVPVEEARSPKPTDTGGDTETVADLAAHFERLDQARQAKAALRGSSTAAQGNLFSVLL